MALRFNGIDIPTFVNVNSIVNSILPPIAQNTVKVSGRAGVLDFGNEINPRVITVAITVIANDQADLKTKVRQLADWLYYEEAKPLIIMDEPNKYYMAKITENTDFNEILHVGQGQLSFVCTQPFAYGEEKEFFFNPSEPIAYPFNNTGGTDTYPKMKFEFTQDTTEFAVVTDEEFLLFGKPLDLVNETPKDPNPLVLFDDMSSLVGWTSATKIDGGTILGTFTTNGYSFNVDDYGESLTNWHGASAVKSLDYPVQDFKLRANIGFKASHANQLGRVEVYLLDINGEHLGKIAMNDTHSNGNYPFAEARAGLLNGGHYFVKTYGSYQGVWQGWNNGLMEMARRGNVWSAYFTIIGTDGKHHTQWTKFWTDTNNLYSDQVASIQIHIGAFKGHPPLDTMWIGDLKVWDESPILAENEVPYIFKTGDLLEIDNETGEVLLNGFPYYNDLNPSSKFIKFKRGENGVTVYPANITNNGEIRYVERWL